MCNANESIMVFDILEGGKELKPKKKIRADLSTRNPDIVIDIN